MKEIFLALLIFGVVAFSLINLKPKEVMVKEVVREVPVVKERAVVKEIPKAVVKERTVIYRTVNHYYTERNHDIVYYRLPDEPRIQPASYDYNEPVKEEKEVAHEEEPEEKPEKPEVKMFFVKGIHEPLWVGAK